MCNKKSPYRYNFLRFNYSYRWKNSAMPANNDHERVDFWDWRVVFDPWHFTVCILTNSVWIFHPARIVGGKATSNSLWALVYGMSYAITNNWSVIFNTELSFFISVQQSIKHPYAFKFFFVIKKTERSSVFVFCGNHIEVYKGHMQLSVTNYNFKLL